MLRVHTINTHMSITSIRADQIKRHIPAITFRHIALRKFLKHILKMVKVCFNYLIEDDWVWMRVARGRAIMELHLKVKSSHFALILNLTDYGWRKILSDNLRNQIDAQSRFSEWYSFRLSVKLSAPQTTTEYRADSRWGCPSYDTKTLARFVAYIPVSSLELCLCGYIIP